MTNNWTDIGNSTCVIVMGANPSENHPACMAHINAARDNNGAKLIVIDPRKTRTAAQADRYIRIRPGTDIAFNNAVLKYVIADMEARSDAVSTKFYDFLNDDSFAFPAFTDQGSAFNVSGWTRHTDARFLVKTDGSDYQRYSTATDPFDTGDGRTIDLLPKLAGDCRDADTVYSRLKAHVAPYDTATAANICGCTEADIVYVANAFIENSRCSSSGAVVGANAQDPNAAGYKATTMLYAMGLTQHTYGSQNVKSFAVIQTLMGNMGRAGGGINALRGIHNVQGSTDMGLLYHLIPGYSGNPTLMPSGGVTVGNDADAFGKYMDGLWGNALSGTGTRTTMDGSYDDAYNTAAMGLQQRGFWNMTQKWFGDASVTSRAGIDALYALWPKTNGDDHITMFRKMGTGAITAAVVWGQNPAVTEPNQGAVRAGLENLDLLVVTDLFETETAAASRKAGSVTYLIPSASHVEEAGSVTNSGRCLQWREKATDPKGNSKSDLELLLRFAKALDDGGAFAHISAVWNTLGLAPMSAYDRLYAYYGWTPGGATAFEDVSGNVEMWRAGAAGPAVEAVKGSEVIAENIYREMSGPVGGGGTLWIYTSAYDTTRTGQKHANQVDWQTDNRAKSRNQSDPNGTLAYPGWGYAWLVNRRVLYNNGEIPGDFGDFFMGPDSVARLFVSTNGSVIGYSRWYRKVHQLADKPDVALGGPTANHILPGRFPAHTEPYETPRADLAAAWGRNTKGTGQWDCVKVDTPVVGRDSLDGTPADGKALADALVLTSIRCVEHFQGGPITRNNAWNVEAEPEPWVEINSSDARKYGIKTGDLVNVITIRGDSTAGQDAITTGPSFAQGFRARVGVGIAANQRVGQGVVAIPWHWGDRGYSTGSRANDLCIDAADANTVIPEYKACLCWIEKA